jgi:hypothetical protein
VRGRYLKNDKMKRELDLTLLYPTYVEGEAQIEAEESPPASAPTDASPASPSEPPASSS